MEKAREANGLSPEFLFGEALYNYYSVWIAENYPLLRPVILFFPNGNKPAGLNQLRHVANHGFYTGVEAKYWLMKIYSDDGANAMESYFIARYLATRYPDNAYFQRFFARQAFVTGHLTESEQVSQDIMNKLNNNMPGYESISGRYATYFLGYVANSRKDLAKAKAYFNQSIAFANQTNEKKSGYAIHSYLYLARIAHQENDIKQAKAYYKIVQDLAEDDKRAITEAKDYLKKYRKV